MNVSQPELDKPPVPRRAPRTSLFLDVGLRKHGSRQAAVVLRDISIHGFRAEAYVRTAPDERLWLRLPGLEGWEARVAWVKGDEIGCEFAQPLHPAVLNIIVAKAGLSLQR
jgi:hypothetical protein